MAGLRRGLRRQRDQLARRRRAAREGRLAGLRARAERLARRRAQDGRGLTAPGFTHEAYASWHPLWVGSPAYAELKPDLDALGLEYLNTDLPTGDGLPRRLERVPLHRRRGERRRARRGVAAAVRRVHGRRRDRLRRPRHRAVVGHGLALGRKAYSQLGRRGLVEFAGHSLLSAPRLAHGRRSRASRRTGCSRRGCCTPGSGPTRRCPAS